MHVPFHLLEGPGSHFCLVNSKFPSPIKARADEIWNCSTKYSKNELKNVARITSIEGKAGFVSPLVVAYAFENQAMYLNVNIQFPIIKNFVQRSQVFI